ncbi:hypothetical protein DFH29DRAFT_881479 [Suillus ampliporus]|nr:hypothetical protein DFH29DRAFT_881479 [Suillus ampliporus]
MVCPCSAARYSRIGERLSFLSKEGKRHEWYYPCLLVAGGTMLSRRADVTVTDVILQSNDLASQCLIDSKGNEKNTDPPRKHDTPQRSSSLSQLIRKGADWLRARQLMITLAADEFLICPYLRPPAYPYVARSSPLYLVILSTFFTGARAIATTDCYTTDMRIFGIRKRGCFSDCARSGSVAVRVRKEIDISLIISHGGEEVVFRKLLQSSWTISRITFPTSTHSEVMTRFTGGTSIHRIPHPTKSVSIFVTRPRKYYAAYIEELCMTSHCNIPPKPDRRMITITPPMVHSQNAEKIYSSCESNVGEGSHHRRPSHQSTMVVLQ